MARMRPWFSAIHPSGPVAAPADTLDQMDAQEALAIVRTHFASQFPRTCDACGHLYPSLAAYLQLTRTPGDFVSYDAAEGSWTPTLGGLLLSNCPCGTTLALTTDTLPWETRRALLEWVLQECARRQLAVEDLVTELTARFLADGGSGEPT